MFITMENIRNGMVGFYQEAIRPALLDFIFNYKIIDVVLYTEHFDHEWCRAGMIFKRYLTYFLGVQE